MPSYQLSINGRAYTVEAEADMPLLWVLRDLLDLTGTKFGCGVASCGACTVLADGVSVRSCVLPVEQAATLQITTIEGLSADGSHPIQRAWESIGVPQCGYCQAGQMMTLAGLLHQNKQPNREELVAAMDQVYCRCGTYHRIKQAVELAIQLSNQ